MSKRRTQNLFRTRGILRKQNFADLKNKPQSLTNILSAAYAGGDFKSEDIGIIKGIHTYGNSPDVAFTTAREYKRFNNIGVKDFTKTQVLQGSGDYDYPLAEPLQTINNQLVKIEQQIGNSLRFEGGDGLFVRYYDWQDVYGEKNTDITSAGGGTYVSKQSAGLGIPYFSPNTAVAPSDSEAFFEFSKNDLANKPISAKEVEWGDGVLNYNQSFHPTIRNATDSGVVYLNGYFNPGFGTAGDSGGVTGPGSIQGNQDRILLIQKSNKEAEEPFAQSSVPVIVKVWDVNQKTGERLTSDDSPLTIVRYAPGLNSPVFIEGYSRSEEDFASNSPMYTFSALNKGGINDALQEANENGQTTTQLKDIGPSAIIAPINDSSPGDANRNKYLNPFIQNHFYAIEMYLILGPRAGDSVIYKSALFQGYDRNNDKGRVLNTKHFFSYNPFKRKKGFLETKIDQSIKNYGTKVSDGATRVSDLSPSFNKHTESMGGNSADKYGRLLSDARINIDYKPPRSWNQIARLKWNAPNFGPQVNSPHKFHYVAYGASRTATSEFNGEVLQAGNLLIDYDSPRPRTDSNASDGSVLDSFTYIDHLGPENDYLYLSKPATGVKIRNSYRDANNFSTTIQAVDHKGIKGYGRGLIKLVDKKGPGGNTGMFLECGQTNLTNPAIFYDGEPFDRDDIIIFESYNDTPFIRVSDASPLGTFVSRLSSQGNNPGVDSQPAATTNSGLQSKGLRPVDNTPSGRNFFVYRHRGLVDKSLDGFCSLYKTGTPTIEALVNEEAETGETKVKIQRNNITSYDGQLYRNAFEINNQTIGGGGGGITSVTVSGAGTTSVNGTYSIYTGSLTHITPKANTTVYNNGDFFFFFCTNSQWFIFKDEEEDNGYYRNTTTTDNPPTSGWQTSTEGTDPAPTLSYVDPSLKPLGIFGMHADYNGNSVPNGTLINKVLDLKYPFTLTITGGSGAGTYILDQYGKSKDTVAAPYNTAIYGNPEAGDYFFRLDGTATTRLVFDNSDNRWELTDGSSTIATYTVPNNTPRGLINHVITTPTTGTGTLSYTSYNSPDAPFELHLTDDSNPFADQALVSTLKRGFGITICDSPERAQVRYQCFPPTDTAPPFRATNTGLRTVPEGNAGDGSNGVGSVEVTYASPNAGVTGTDQYLAPISSITTDGIRIEGGYGNNSPFVNNKPLASALHPSAGEFIQPGGVLLLDDEESYDKIIDFDFQFVAPSAAYPDGIAFRFGLLASTSSDV